MKPGWKYRRKKVVADTEKAMVYSDVACVACGGSGRDGHHKLYACEWCDGTGKTHPFTGDVQCLRCLGTGEAVVLRNPNASPPPIDTTVRNTTNG